MVVPKVSKSFRHKIPRNNAPVPSIIKVSLKIAEISDRERFKSSPKFSLMKFCCRIPKPPRSMAKSAAKEMIFNPPNCINSITMNWPLPLKTVLMSIKLKPVTQLAEILVNNAVNRSSPDSPGMVISGSINKQVPSAIKTKKLKTNSVGGLSFDCGKSSPTLPNSSPTMTRT